MAFGGNCPQCALSHYACQHLLSSTSYIPDSQLLSKYVTRANVTATKFVCLEKAGYLLPGPHKLCPAKFGYFSPKVRTTYLDRKYISWTNCIWSKCHRSYERAFLSILSISWKTFLNKKEDPN